MRARTLGVLALAAVLAAGGAAWVRHRQRAAGAPETLPERLFPGLEDRIGDVAAIAVQKGDERLTVEKREDGWAVAEKAGYPARLEAVRKAIVGLARMRPLQPLTSNPDQYQKIGVQPAGPGSDSVLLTLRAADGSDLAALIAGRTTWAGGESAQYVRKPDESRAWKVGGDLGVQGSPVDWMEREVLKVEADRIRAVSVTHPGGGRVEVERAERGKPDFKLLNLPDGWKLKWATAANSLSSVLEYMNFDDVLPAEQAPQADAVPVRTEFRTYDGLLVVSTIVEKDGKYYARFEAAFEEPPVAGGEEAGAADATPEGEGAPPAESAGAGSEGAAAAEKPAGKSAEEVQKEVEELNSRLRPWVFVLPSWKAQSLAKKLEDLAEPEKKEEAAQEDAGALEGGGEAEDENDAGGAAAPPPGGEGR